MKLSLPQGVMLGRLTALGLGAVGLLIVVWGAVWLFSAPPAKTGPATVDERHCPDCGRELPRSYWGTGECPYCAAEKGDRYVPSKKRVTSVAFNPLIPTSLVVTFCLLLAIHGYLIARTRALQKTGEVLYYAQCSSCGRRIRYREKQAGQVALCPLCRKPVIFPKLSTGPKSRWRAIAHVIWPSVRASGG